MRSSFRRKVRIVCTLGPATETMDQISALIEEGMDVARLNFSHGTYEFYKNIIANIREAARRANKPIAIMQDLQGPKLRVGILPEGGLDLRRGDTIILYPEDSNMSQSCCGKISVPISAEVAQAVSSAAALGTRILFDDGRIAVRVTSVSPPEIVAEVEVGGRLTDHKGINIPGTSLPIPSLTAKDVNDLEFGVLQGVDAVALSFVRAANDITLLKERMEKLTSNPPLVIAKIEREEAIDCYESIIDVADGLLIARGDMAVEVGAEHVPAIQKKLIHSCRRKGVAVITATQMLESMISSPTPTRAEASDVANAVFDGTDAVMLSGETASGQYPCEAVRTMARIVLEAERRREFYSGPRDILPTPGYILESIEFSASRIAHHVGAVAIACLTHSGAAARTLAKFRPETPIVAIMDSEAMLRRLSFTWGVRGVLIPGIAATDDLFAMVENVLIAHGWAELGDLVVVTAGIPTLKRGTTNMVKVHRIGAQGGRNKEIRTNHG